MTVISYIRVSSTKQTLEHQRYEMQCYSRRQALHVDKWIEETVSTRKSLTKRKLGELLETIKKGDVLIACELSRLGRSLLEIMRILEICLSKECQVWTIKENYKLGHDIQSKVLAFAFGLAAEIERNLISQRTGASLANLKAQGQKLGRPTGALSKNLKLDNDIQRIQKLREQGYSENRMAQELGVGRSTLRRYFARLKEREGAAMEAPLSIREE